MSRTFELNTEEIRKRNDELDKKVFKFENFSKYYTEEDYRLIKNSEVGKNLLRSIYVLDLIEEKGIDNIILGTNLAGRVSAGEIAFWFGVGTMAVGGGAALLGFITIATASTITASVVTSGSMYIFGGGITAFFGWEILQGGLTMIGGE